MRGYYRILTVFLLAIFLASIVRIPIGESCKDIIATPQATGVDYSLLLKVRDPSRPGLQVLTCVPRGTTYTYHHPWTGQQWDFTVAHTFFGVATKGDTLPSIVKAGMVLTDAGLAFGDADTPSNWINPTKNAWDDFDWIRYACQTADNEQQAITFLTTDVIDKLHATGVSENLFLVGPTQSAVIEADAVHYITSTVENVWVMSNYPINLWKTEVLKSRQVARAFNTTKETWARQGSIVHLGSTCGVKILKITNSSLTMKPVPSIIFRLVGQGNPVTCTLGQRATVGPYSVILQDIQVHKVKLSVQTAVHAWEQELLSYIQPAIGHITIQDMIIWSRLHATDLDGLRPVCDDTVPYEAAMVFKVPQEHADLLSSGWFSANHACSSIYVPVHICDNDIYDPYQTGDAAQLSLDLLKKYGHSALIPSCENVEEVFLAENNISETIAHAFIHNEINITLFMTVIDRGMQEQAYLTEQLWLGESNATRDIIDTIWKDNYSTSLDMMGNVASILQTMSGTTPTVTQLEDIALSICKTRIDQATILGMNCTEENQEYSIAKHEFAAGETINGFIHIQHIFHSTTH